MTVELETGWHLRSVMAARGIFQTSKLKPLLEERGIDLSREQVTQPPQRVRLDVLAALCDALECSLGDLVSITRRETAAAPVAVGEEPTRGSIGDLRPVRATIRRPRTK
jgi:DNA-binding Xre family transcriptional regulator